MRSVVCDRCDYSRNVSMPPRSYLFGDIMHCDVNYGLSIEQVLCWCKRCNEAVAGEHIPSLAELESNYEFELEQSPCQAFGVDETERRQLEAMTRIDWRRDRKSPPKCLECGSTAIHSLFDRFDYSSPKTSPHPGCEGQLRAYAAYITYGCLYFYSTEGDEIDD